MNAPTPTAAAPTLANRLVSVRVGLREDLEVSRHLFRGQPTYIVRDPITLQNQRLDPADYHVFVSINTERTLGEVFADLVDRGLASEENEEKFYMFVMGLHRLGFLRLPISDEKLLYQRHIAKQRAQRRQKLLGFLFLRIPVINPSTFLDRTIRYFRPMFTQTALVLWLLLMGCAAYVACRNWDRMLAPLEGVLAARNLGLIWITLIVLKVFHEFGHAYACRHYGGHVPEMGIYLIVFTPCAYVDATACWGFVRKRERLIVCLGGMYFESIIAAIAVFVWALTTPSLLNSLAYNVVFLAGVVTVLFNINPLMRYDGYYILSDLTEVPNLRSRAARYVVDALKRIALRLPVPKEPGGRRLRILLFGFGVAAALYRIGLLLGIAAVLAMKMFVVGLGMAVLYVGGTVIRTVVRLTKYLWMSQEAQPVRGRAVACSLCILAVVPAALCMLPVPSAVQAVGVITTEQKTVLRAKEPGFLTKVRVAPGERIEPAGVVAELSNPALGETLAFAQADLRASDIRKEAYRVLNPDKVSLEEEKSKAYRAAVRQAEVRIEGLTVSSPLAGEIIDGVDRNALGSFVNTGDAVATIAAGRWQVKTVLSEEELYQASPQIGETVLFRPAAYPSHTIEASIGRIVPAGSRSIREASLTHLGGGDIAVDPDTGEAREPYFEVTINLPDDPGPSIGHGMTGSVLMGGDSETIGTTIYRRLARFMNRLMQD